ncbi:type II toxin-antitoxin system RelE/ParE family toxin, partial [Enterococcus casseliflavus]|uniref:type II toxin-antitoxin system RelE/ParE family toxin n=1 Tax=Enterococcus casseliflavus TaxID=37734 RepID=UPI003D13392F
MSQGFRLTPLAEQDVREIVLYVATQFGRVRAERVREEFLTAFRLLAERPEIGRHRPELWPEPYRFWPLG